MTATEMFNTFYAQHVGHVRRVAATRVRIDDQGLVEDLVQEAFLRLWVYLQRGNTVTNPGALLGTMTRRAAADHYRLCRNTRERATDLGDPLASRIVPVEPSAEDIALLHAELNRLLAEFGTQVPA